MERVLAALSRAREAAEGRDVRHVPLEKATHIVLSKRG